MDSMEPCISIGRWTMVRTLPILFSSLIYTLTTMNWIKHTALRRSATSGLSFNVCPLTKLTMASTCADVYSITQCSRGPWFKARYKPLNAGSLLLGSVKWVPHQDIRTGENWSLLQKIDVFHRNPTNILKCPNFPANFAGIVFQRAHKIEREIETRERSWDGRHCLVSSHQDDTSSSQLYL